MYVDIVISNIFHFNKHFFFSFFLYGTFCLRTVKMSKSSGMWLSLNQALI